MPETRVLACWIGHNDMRAMAATLPSPHQEDILRSLGGPTPVAGELGPIKSLLQQERFDEIRLLSNYPPTWEEQFADWLGGAVSVHHVALNNPTDYAEIFVLADVSSQVLACLFVVACV